MNSITKNPRSSLLKGSQMLIPTLIMAVIAIILIIVGFNREGNIYLIGLKSAWQMTYQVLPLLIFAFIVAGMIQVLLPQDLLNKWVGTESGLRGIVIGMVAGGLTPGGPYVSLPVIASLLKAGAGIGTMVAFLTSWSLWAIARLPMEVGILGWKFTLVRLASTFFFPPIAGLIAQFLFANFNK
jgi:uncharacterized membrane protein YraQ (UPF0718 family)